MTDSAPGNAASDPTYGRIDADIQHMVDESQPRTLGQRVAMENTLQARRDERWRADADGPFVAHWRGCCRHTKASHDQHGCTVDVSTDRRCYYRCHDDDQPALDPRWRDYHTLPDEWLLRPIQKWFYRRKRVRPDGTVQYPFHLRWLVILLSRYSLRHFHCPKDGQCVFRAKHRGSCSWGSDDDD